MKVQFKLHVLVMNMGIKKYIETIELILFETKRTYNCICSTFTMLCYQFKYRCFVCLIETLTSLSLSRQTTKSFVNIIHFLQDYMLIF